MKIFLNKFLLVVGSTGISVVLFVALFAPSLFGPPSISSAATPEFGASFCATNTSTLGISEDECTALERIWTGTDGLNWTTTTNWGTVSLVNTWYGITVSSTSSTIESIDLSGNNLSGTISSIAELKNLTSLELHENQLTSIDLSGLTNLKILDLFENQLTNIDLSGLTSLVYLYLSRNQLTSIDLSGLDNLLHLDISENMLTFSDLEGINQNILNSFLYDEQANVDTTQTVTTTVGTPIILSATIDESGTNDAYQWYIGTGTISPIFGATSTDFTVTPSVVADTVYTYRITNDDLPNLTLISNQFTVQVIPTVMFEWYTDDTYTVTTTEPVIAGDTIYAAYTNNTFADTKEVEKLEIQLTTGSDTVTIASTEEAGDEGIFRIAVSTAGATPVVNNRLELADGDTITASIVPLSTEESTVIDSFENNLWQIVQGSGTTTIITEGDNKYLQLTGSSSSSLFATQIELSENRLNNVLQMQARVDNVSALATGVEDKLGIFNDITLVLENNGKSYSREFEAVTFIDNEFVTLEAILNGENTGSDIAGPYDDDIWSTGSELGMYIIFALEDEVTLNLDIDDLVFVREENFNEERVITRTATVETTGGSNRGGGGAYIPPSPPTLPPGVDAMTALKINNGAVTTDNKIVSLQIADISNVRDMAISNTSDFSGVSYVPFSSTVARHTLIDGNGEKTVYVKLRSSQGGTMTLTDTITLTGQSFDQTTETNPTSEEIKNCPLQVQSAYKVPLSNAIYYITKDCTKRGFSSSDLYFTYFSRWSDTQLTTQTLLNSVPKDTIGFLPLGPRYVPTSGSLVKTLFDAKTYLLLQGTLYHIEDELAAEFQFGPAWATWIEGVDERLLQNYPLSNIKLNTTDRPDGMLIKYANDPKVYQLNTENNQQVKQWIPNLTIFRTLNFRDDRIVTIPDTETYPDGADVIG